MTHTNFTYQRPKAPALYSQEAFIAIITFLCIIVHLALKFIFHVPDFYQQLPLYIALIVGGIPLVLRLIVKLIHLEFSSDLLAGMSIVTAVLLDQALVGAIVVLML